MALDPDALKAHLNMTDDEVDDLDDTVMPRLLDAAKAHAESVLGYKLDDTTHLPDGAPADLEQAVLMIAAHWFNEREAVLIGVTGQSIPFGADQILGEHRIYTYG